MSKKLKDTISLLGIQKVSKDLKVKWNVFENIIDAIKAFGRSMKKDTSVALNSIQTTVVSTCTTQKTFDNTTSEKNRSLKKVILQT